MIVAAIMTLHNYVRAHDREDVRFAQCDRDPNYVSTIPERYKWYVVRTGTSDSSASEASGSDMDEIRDQLVTVIDLSW